ncbi:hypothetical protein GCM10023200_45430 [Actinomycetospora chlora]|uniref:Glycosyltransferase RgtA/B/C/D-like domain-containing protein n=1 Tax=Actinomycetospora chlora TaxID=663608 RepID=A0ABP9C2D7_9PSEU
MTTTAGTVPLRAAVSHPSPAPRAPHGWGRGDVVVTVLLVAVALVWFHWLAAGASAQGVITGEEASISHRDALALRLGWQPSIWSTNVGGQLFFWLAGHLDPDYGLLYARKWKAAATALLPAVVYLVARRRLACGRPAGAVAGVLAVVVPGVAMLAWVGIETPLDVVAGLAAVYAATSRTRWWWLGLPLAGVAVSCYTAGLAVAAVVLLPAVLRVRGVRDGARAVLGLALGLAVLFVPLLWWRNGGIVVTGGGRAGADPGAVGEHLRQLADYAFVSGSSYYYVAELPLFGSALAAAVLLAGAVAGVALRPRPTWPWAAVGLASLALYAVSSGVPGARRVVVAVAVVALLAGVAVDALVRAVAAAPRRGVLVAGRVVLAVAVASLVAVPAGAVAGWRGEIAAGAVALPRDWPFPVDPGGTQTTTLQRLDADLRTGRLDVRAVGDGWGGTRTLAMLYVLAERTGRVPPLTPRQLLDYYRVSEDCPPLDGPACG